MSSVKIIKNLTNFDESDEIVSINFSSDGKYLAAGSLYNRIIIFTVF